VLKTPRPIFSSTRALTEACCTCCVKAPGGGSNFTGSLSGTARVTPVVLASLSGFVSTSSGAGIGGAVSTLTIARATGGAGILARVVFVAAIETGCLAWYLAVLLGARKVPPAARHRVERAALLLIGGMGAWLAASAL